MNWQALSTDSHYKTAVAIRTELELGHVDEAAKGIEELIQALSRSEKHCRVRNGAPYGTFADEYELI